MTITIYRASRYDASVVNTPLVFWKGIPQISANHIRLSERNKHHQRDDSSLYPSGIKNQAQTAYVFYRKGDKEVIQEAMRALLFFKKDTMMIFQRLLMSIPSIIEQVGFDFSWDITKVWRLDEPVIIVPIETLIWHFDIPFWESEGSDTYNLCVWQVLSTPDREPTHWSKILTASLEYPIDVMPNKGKLLILDGLHRLAKYYLQGTKEISIRIIPRSRIPEIIEDELITFPFSYSHN